MKYLSTHALVLKRFKTGEADRTIIALTKDHGKLMCIAKGVRRITSRRAAHLEIFSHINLRIHKSKDINYITEVQTISTFSHIASNLRTIAAVYHLCEITDKLVPQGDTSHSIYLLLLAALKNIEGDKAGINLRKIVRLYIGDLLFNLGFMKEDSQVQYSKLVTEVENILEKQLTSKKLLTYLSQIQAEKEI